MKPAFENLIKEKKPFYYFVKEAGAIRSLPDIVICCNGKFIVWELKRSRQEAEKTTGRIVLQKYTLLRIQRAQGHAVFVHPENFQEELQVLNRELCR